MQLAPFPVVIPLLAAALLSALSDVLPRRLTDLICCTVSLAVLVVSYLLIGETRYHPIVYWFGGWTLMHKLPVGISFVIDPTGATLAAFVALLVFYAFVFSWRYFESVKTLFHAVMLVFLGAMCGLALTGDLFNLFVWFELMTAAGVALCGYKAEETGPLQGAINFAVSNTLGAFLSLTGIAMLYAQTGALNMAQVGKSLAEHSPGDTFVMIALVFFAAGFLVKSAAFPFHFWLADAHAVAPTPVCILFSGVMVELGLYAVTRVYWVVFAQSLHGHEDTIRALFLTVGACTALVGGIGCFGQRHLKRLLAFSTISHMGIMIIGFGLLDSSALAGAGLYVLGHGALKAALFIGAGIVLNRFGSVDEFDLQGVGRRTPIAAVVMFVGALGLAGVPPFGNFFGESNIDDGLDHAHLSWMSYVLMLAGILTAGAVLRVSFRIFLGMGEREDSGGGGGKKIEMEPETGARRRRTPTTMYVPALMLLAISLCVGVSPKVRDAAEHAAERLTDTAGYWSAVLTGTPGQLPTHTPPAHFPPFWRELVNAGLALAIALFALYPKRLGSVGVSVTRALGVAMKPFRAIHSGKIGDYVAWFMFGIAAFGGYLLLASRS